MYQEDLESHLKYHPVQSSSSYCGRAVPTLLCMFYGLGELSIWYQQWSSANSGSRSASRLEILLIAERGAHPTLALYDGSAIELAINSATPLSPYDIVPTTTLAESATKKLAERQQLSFDEADCRSTAEVTRPSNANRTKTRTPCERSSGSGDTAEPESFQLSHVLTDQVPLCLPGYKGYVLSFSGSAKLDNIAEQGSCSWILCSLPTWDIVTASCFHLESATTTIAKCTGLSKGIWSAIEHGVTD
ncbi:unnamed protein product [Phytophthora fragariaefolia]|uniref:Unnamed protein product n=1 Tax=Phytophthora fragariaefolia TaxID=1490495 RepID=A0A9W6XDX4_9STRA|nr:unnamed protein product [Phytophthora fragariaefolia]